MIAFIGGLQTTFWFLILLGVMVLIHELGHFWAARAFDVRVDVFSIGFGPRLFGFKRGDTDYRFSLILFGGYVKMAGEQPLENLQPGKKTEQRATMDPRGLLSKPRWQRLIVAFAGPFMNIILAVALLTGLFMVRYEHIVEPGGAIIGHILESSPAEKAGLLAGDKITQIDGEKNPTWDDINRHEATSAERSMEVTIERNGQQFTKSVTPVLDDRVGIATSGWEEVGDVIVRDVTANMPAEAAGVHIGDLLVSIDGQPIRSRFKLQEVIRKNSGAPVALEYARGDEKHTVSIKPVMSAADGKAHFMIGVAPGLRMNVVTEKLSFPAALRESLKKNQESASLIVNFLRGLVERRMSAKAVDGPIGMARMAGQAAKMGPMYFILLMAGVSLNLAIFNLLPIPILDGGMILLLLVELLLGRDLSDAFKEGVLRVGFVFLMAVVVFVLYNDISKVFTQG